MKQDLAQIEQFLDALWLERNLAENTLKTTDQVFGTAGQAGVESG